MAAAARLRMSEDSSLSVTRSRLARSVMGISPVLDAVEQVFVERGQLALPVVQQQVDGVGEEVASVSARRRGSAGRSL